MYVHYRCILYKLKTNIKYQINKKKDTHQMILKLSEKSNWNKVSMIQVSNDLDNKLIFVYLIFKYVSPKRLLRHHWGNACGRIADL